MRNVGLGETSLAPAISDGVSRQAVPQLEQNCDGVQKDDHACELSSIGLVVVEFGQNELNDASSVVGLESLDYALIARLQDRCGVCWQENHLQVRQLGAALVAGEVVDKKQSLLPGSTKLSVPLYKIVFPENECHPSRTPTRGKSRILMTKSFF